MFSVSQTKVKNSLLIKKKRTDTEFHVNESRERVNLVILSQNKLYFSNIYLMTFCKPKNIPVLCFSVKGIE